MLKTCSSVLLLTKDNDLIHLFEETGLSCDVAVHSERKWNDNYRVHEECVVCESEYLENINTQCFEDNMVVVVLKEDESFVPLKNKVSRFIFNRLDVREIMFSFLEPERMKEGISTVKIKGNPSFVKGSYEFHFDLDEYFYRGKGIYLSKSDKEYLSKWLLGGFKDNKKRMRLCNMRKKFGKSFLKDVNRFGELEEEQDDD